MAVEEGWDKNQDQEKHLVETSIFGLIWRAPPIYGGGNFSYFGLFSTKEASFPQIFGIYPQG